MARLLALFFLIFSLPAHGQKLEQAKPWLGVAIDKGDLGVLVKDVIPGTPAEDAGFKKGDQITAVDQTKVKIPEELIKAVQASGVGNTVTVKFSRSGKEETRKVKLVARPDQLEVIRKTLVGKPAPAMDLTSVHGPDPVKTADLKGKVVLVEFWATWCPACRSTHGKLSKLAKDKRKDGLVVLAVSDEEEADLKAYAGVVKPEFTIARDATHATARDYMVSAIPMLAVIDRDGKVAFATIGSGSYLDEALVEIDKLLAKK